MIFFMVLFVARASLKVRLLNIWLIEVYTSGYGTNMAATNFDSWFMNRYEKADSLTPAAGWDSLNYRESRSVVVRADIFLPCPVYLKN